MKKTKSSCTQNYFLTLISYVVNFLNVFSAFGLYLRPFAIGTFGCSYCLFLMYKNPITGIVIKKNAANAGSKMLGFSSPYTTAVTCAGSGLYACSSALAGSGSAAVADALERVKFVSNKIAETVKTNTAIDEATPPEKLCFRRIFLHSPRKLKTPKKIVFIHKGDLQII
jgi:hypothetical protein